MVGLVDNRIRRWTGQHSYFIIFHSCLGLLEIFGRIFVLILNFTMQFHPSVWLIWRALFAIPQLRIRNSSFAHWWFMRKRKKNCHYGVGWMELQLIRYSDNCWRRILGKHKLIRENWKPNEIGESVSRWKFEGVKTGYTWLILVILDAGKW